MTDFNTLTANASYVRRTGAPQYAEIRAKFVLESEANEFAALFAKSHLMKVRRVTVSLENRHYWMVSTDIDLLPVKGNDRNETGIKRFRMIALRANKAGWLVHWTAPYSNSFATAEEFEASIA